MEGFLHIPKIRVITYNSPLKFGGGVFFRAVLGGKDIILFNGATVALSFFRGFKLQQLRGGTGGYQLQRVKPWGKPQD